MKIETKYYPERDGQPEFNVVFAIQNGVCVQATTCAVGEDPRAALIASFALSVKYAPLEAK